MEICVISFDVDDTLDISNGPVPLEDLRVLKMQGHIIGVNGNWGRFLDAVKDWAELISFYGPKEGSTNGKVFTLMKAKHDWPFAEQYIFVGNVPAWFNRPVSNDIEAAVAANWTFIPERYWHDWAKRAGLLK
jgi:hypothetical protein